MKVVVVGAGTAGCLSALLFKQKFPNTDVTMIKSSEIGTMVVGESLTPQIHKVLADLGISIEEFIQNTNGTIKNGIRFINWGVENESWFHGFYDFVLNKREIFKDQDSVFDVYKTAIGLDNNADNINFSTELAIKNKVDTSRTDDFAIHVDSRLLANYLESVAKLRGIHVIDDKVVELFNDSNNNITGMLLESGNTIDCNFVVDCSGLKRLILKNHYNSEWVSVKHHLPATSAIACQLPMGNTIPSYTDAIAMEYGWAWKIPLQNRYGCGYVYDSSFITEDQAKNEALELWGDELEFLGSFSFEPGYFKDLWINNCLGVGISSVFFEPLEATAIANVINVLYAFLDHCFYNYINGSLPEHGDGSREFFNTVIHQGQVSLTSFLYLHYITNKTNNDFWKGFKTRHEVPDVDPYSVKKFLSEMNKSLKYDEILTPPTWRLYSWMSIYAGNELHKNSIEVDTNSSVEYNRVKDTIGEMVNLYSTHEEYLNNIMKEIR